MHGQPDGRQRAGRQRAHAARSTGWRTSLYGDFLYDMRVHRVLGPRRSPALEGVDLRGLFTHHLRVTGQKVPDLDARMTCYMIHAACSRGMAASAYTGDLATLAATTARLIPLIR